MDEAVRLENISMMNACDDAELRLRILRNNGSPQLSGGSLL